jgi:hypothetical protein
MLACRDGLSLLTPEIQASILSSGASNSIPAQPLRMKLRGIRRIAAITHVSQGRKLEPGYA